MLHVSVSASGWNMKSKLLVTSLSCYLLQLFEMMLKTCKSLSHHYCLWIQRRDVVVGCVLYVLNLVWKDWEKLKMQQGFRQFSVVSTILYHYWSQKESCKFWYMSAKQSSLGSGVKKTSCFLSVFLIRLSLSSCACECHLICLPELPREVSVQERASFS